MVLKHHKPFETFSRPHFVNSIKNVRPHFVKTKGEHRQHVVDITKYLKVMYFDCWTIFF